MEPDAEIMTLSAMFLNREAAENVAELLGDNVAAFTDDSRARLYGLFLEMLELGLPFDALVVHKQIKERNLGEVITLDFLKDIASAAPSHAMAEYHAAIVADAYQRRRLITALDKSLADAYDATTNIKAIADRIEARIMEASDAKIETTNRPISSVLDDMINRDTTPTGIKSGYIELDDMTNGFHGGEMTVLAARPSVGKTAITLNILEYICVTHKIPAVLFSLEMKTERILERLLSVRSGVNMQKIRRNIFNREESAAMGQAVGDLREAPLLIDDSSSLTLFELRAKARRYKSKHGVRFIALDYLQLMDASERAENRQQEITKISRGIKTLAGELDVPILCLSQLNRSSETEGRRPRSSDLRESGAIEQDADAVLLLHREDVMNRGNPDWIVNNRAELILSKQRNGPCGVCNLIVMPETTRFGNAV